nr:hypothetical protein [Nocardioides massiliensis]
MVEHPVELLGLVEHEPRHRACGGEEPFELGVAVGHHPGDPGHAVQRRSELVGSAEQVLGQHVDRVVECRRVEVLHLRDALEPEPLHRVGVLRARARDRVAGPQGRPAARGQRQVALTEQRQHLDLRRGVDGERGVLDRTGVESERDPHGVALGGDVAHPAHGQARDAHGVTRLEAGGVHELGVVAVAGRDQPGSSDHRDERDQHDDDAADHRHRSANLLAPRPRSTSPGTPATRMVSVQT